ncbi:MAG: serine/threonine-protein kinase [Polyangiales bacterium]
MDDPLLPGALVGPYRVERRLGGGAAGDVYRAARIDTEEPVALKVLRGVDGDARSSHAREAAAGAAFRHPNVAAVYDAGEVDGRLWIAMELVEGKTLRAFVGDPSVPAARRVAWVADVARALAAAHDAGLVHRDVKPDNVMVRDDGAVKVLDFGLARLRAADPTLSSWSAAGRAVGTPAYMAPEQLWGGAVDARCDQWAWALTAWELFAGAVPWPDLGSMPAVVTAVLHEPIAPLRERCPDAPPALAAAVDRALTRDPAGRFASMHELVASLDVTPTSPPAAPLRSAPSPPRRRTALALAGTAIVAVALAASRLPRRAPTVAPTPAAAVTLATLPPPLRCERAVNPAYREGLDAIRAGSWLLAHAAFQRAFAVDPSCPEVALRLLVTGYWVANATERRRWYRLAWQSRGRMRERDRVLLDTFEPTVVREPLDRDEYVRRLRAMAARYPDDAEVWATLAFHGDDFEARVAAARRALALDPAYPDAWQGMAGALRRLGRTREAAAAYARCRDAVPAAADCATDLASLQLAEGRCAEMLATGRALAAVAPDHPAAYLTVAQAMASLGEAREAVEAAVRQRAAQVTAGPLRAMHEAFDLARSAALYGDFEAARAQARRLAADAAGSADVDGPLRAAWLDVELAREEGRAADGLDAAARFLAGRPAWTGGGVTFRYHTFAQYAEPAMLDDLRRAGRLDDAARAAGLARWERSLTVEAPQLPLFRWAFTRALGADTAAQAVEALRAAPPEADPGVVITRASVLVLATEAVHGAVALRAGDLTAARASLGRATASCLALEDPFLHTRAWRWLGDVHARAGDVPAACEAYRVVVRRWGASRSVNARDARAAMASLRCPDVPH